MAKPPLVVAALATGLLVGYLLGSSRVFAALSFVLWIGLWFLTREARRYAGCYASAYVVGVVAASFGWWEAALVAFALLVLLCGPRLLKRVYKHRYPKMTETQRRLVAAIAALLMLSVALLERLAPERCCGSYESIAVLGPFESAPGESFTSTLELEFAGCHKPVVGRLVVGGSEDYWRAYDAHNAGRTRRHRAGAFLVSLPYAETRIRDVWLTEEGRALAYPSYLDPVNEHATGEDGAESRKLAKPRVRLDDKLRTESGGVASPARWGKLADPGDDGWPVVRGYVDDWAKHRSVLVIDFEGDWTRRRDLSTCFIDAPALTGESTVEQAASVLANFTDEFKDRAHGFAEAPVFERYRKQALKAVPNDALYVFRYAELDGDTRSSETERVLYRRSWEVVTGSLTIGWSQGGIDAGASSPTPQQSDNGKPTWQCTPEPFAGAGRRTPAPGVDADDPGVALNDAYLRSPIEDCRVLAVMQSGEAWTDREFLLVIAGALVGIIAALFVELQVHRRR